MAESDPLIDRLKISDAQRHADVGRPVWPWVAGLLVIAVLAIGAWRLLGGPSAVEVELVQPVRESSDAGSTAASVLDASGYVVARRQATVAAEVTGKLAEVLIEEGMRVEQGQVLARMDDATERAQLALTEARLRAAETALQEIRVQLEDAQRTLERQRELRDRELASQSDLDRAETQVRALEARLANGREQIEVARSEMALQAQLLEELTVRAPFSGVIIARAAQAGEMVSPISAGGGFTRTGIGTIVDMDSLEIEVDVNESFIDRVRPGQRVTAVLDAYPDWAIPAEVNTVVPAADRQKATVRVRVSILERDPRILPEMGISVRFLDEETVAPTGADTAPALTVPASAVFDVETRRYVWRVEDGRLERRAVSTGARRGDRVVILAGLTERDRIVENAGRDALAAGVAVREGG
ncbi:efflux RND transporter periplasmic adaptor subunit [Wenzhouxiangella sp. XN79A]|uniref:efflux RND transporter periplasmic adaptor subunit n=1 Tax=Wenzhouxiangella sp. XN79A TaxID=2724193 RepID=UPI00144AB03D|nr:efflux RND transporter periplasmic adaptor subunit [Wenzhouxiangella sp. XN79A]NKI36208.1 efflux RND transporter periplasmic adaptor subunit [Wenzhouxiangella sp. XN79A]